VKFRYLYIIAIVGFIIEILVTHSNYISEWQLIISFAWVINFYSNPQTSFMFLLPTSIIFELFTFKHVGVVPFTFCISLLILFFLKNYLNVLSDEQRYRINSIGLALNLILLSILTYFLYSRLLILKIIIGILLSFGQFFLFTKLIKIKTNIKYET
jgi:hypothetical protein